MPTDNDIITITTSRDALETVIKYLTRTDGQGAHSSSPSGFRTGTNYMFHAEDAARRIERDMHDESAQDI